VFSRFTVCPIFIGENFRSVSASFIHHPTRFKAICLHFPNFVAFIAPSIIMVYTRQQILIN